MNLTQKTLHSITKHQLTHGSDLVIVGVSGGADSVCLLHVLYKLRHQLGIKLHIAHFNHRLRTDSDKDEIFVKNLAAQLDLPISVGQRNKASTKTISEDQARKLRFAFFQKVIQQTKAQSIALAHTQNDLAETVLMRLIRGTGLLGLRGILSANNINEIRIIRPLLDVQRSQIEEYLNNQKLKFCTDKTNHETFYLRNKLRLKLLPLLIKEYNPNLPQTLIDLASNSGEDYDYLVKQGGALFKKTAKISKKGIEFSIKTFLLQHTSMRRLLLRLSFEVLTKDFLELSFAHISEVEDMLSNRPVGSVVHWPKSIEVKQTPNSLILRRRK